MIQRRLLLVVLTTVAAAIAALLVGFNVILDHTLNSNARSVLRSRAAAQLELVDVTDGTLRLADAPNSAAPDTGAWVMAQGRVLERPRARPAVDAAAIRLAQSSRSRYLDLGRYDVRLYARPVFSGGKRVGAVVVPLSVVPYEETRRTAFVSSLIFGALPSWCAHGVCSTASIAAAPGSKVRRGFCQTVGGTW